MGGLSRKYVVFKAEDWDRFSTLNGTDSDYHTLNCGVFTDKFALDDAVVLRKQDIFTSSALYEYAGQIRTTIELMQRVTEQGDDLASLLTRLRIMADQFADEAESAETEFARKIPD